MLARSIRTLLLAPAFALVALVGCGPAKLDVTKSYSLSAGEAQAIIPDAQPKAQVVKVEYSSTAADVKIGVFKEADAKEPSNADFKKAIKSEKGKGGTFQADVPENTPYLIIVEAMGKTDVKIHITN